MTHTTVATERESGGSKDEAYHTIDITGLDRAGEEDYDADAELGLEDPARFGIDIRAQEDETVKIDYDHLNDQLTVINVADATAVAQGTDVGEVMLHVVGH
jgi:hypothetical protein